MHIFLIGTEGTGLNCNQVCGAFLPGRTEVGNGLILLNSPISN